MKVERNTTVLPPPIPSAKPAATRPPTDSPTTRRTVESLLAALRGDGSRQVALAPLRLDVLGGLGEYTGGAVLGVPTAEHVGVAVQARSDGKLRLDFANSRNGRAGVELPIADLLALIDDPVALRARFHLGADALVVGAIAAVAEGSKAGLFAAPKTGLSVCVAGDLEPTVGSRQVPPLIAATLAACAALAETQLDSRQTVAVCARVQRDWLQDTASLADATSALLAKPGSTLQVQGDSVATQALPEHLTILGVDCGAVHQDAVEKYRHVRVTTLMGRLLVQRIMRYDQPKSVVGDDPLARITMKDFVERFRDRIPTKMKGREFLKRFGETGDSLTRIDPDAVYKIRSRTEHHVYEQTRVQEFVELLAKASRSHERTHLLAAAELLSASHWSYGQRCGMGSIETDLLVNLIRKGSGEDGDDAHQETDIYAAKISGRGCGGTVAVLMEQSDTARHALDSAIDRYAAKSGRTPRVLGPGIPGALVGGVHAE